MSEQRQREDGIEKTEEVKPEEASRKDDPSTGQQGGSTHNEDKDSAVGGTSTHSTPLDKATE